ncbi:MAG: 1,4-dihydroxy-6-naphthoate synthase, partial [Cellulosilyticaceae bacterium]
MNLSLAFSPCPNDTFAFHAMINSLVDTEGLTFNVEMADVEELNMRAAKGKYDICKLSYHAFFTIANKYIMLRSGSALGFNNGPLLVKKMGIKKELPNSSTIAIPGIHTTAALLLKTAYPQYYNLKPMLFSSIEDAILKGEVDAGVLIHEGRFTYREKGLELIIDLGEFWQNSFHQPIPLGGIAIKRELQEGEYKDGQLAKKINRVLRKSIIYAYEHPLESKSFIMNNAQEITEQVQQKHINLFVNNFTLDIGEQGEKAV